MKKIGLFPGTFDPITIGHVDIVQRAIPLLDEIIIGIGSNQDKNTYFPLEKRQLWIKDIFKDSPTVSVATYSGLTVDFCQQMNASFIIRGIRNSIDFDFEKNIAQVNKSLHGDIETVFLMCDPAHSAVSSSIVRDIIRNGGDASKLLPEQVIY